MQPRWWWGRRGAARPRRYPNTCMKQARFWGGQRVAVECGMDGRRVWVSGDIELRYRNTYTVLSQYLHEAVVMLVDGWVGRGSCS